MPVSQVLRLQDYRSRRDRRFEQALALYSADKERALLLRYLWSAAAVASGDRAAVVWIDEYGPGLVHSHVILDLIADRPRRAFAIEPLRMAWSEGVPGLHDACERETAGGVLDPAGYRSICAVALGSDGLRAWFVVVDGQAPRPRLGAQSTAEMMFLAGECSALLMHRDMKGAEETVLVPEGGRERFAAWPVLKDIEGREKDEEANRRISCRFLVGRVVRALLDDDLATDREALEHQITCVRRELAGQFRGDPERPLWEAVLSAAERDDRADLVGAVLNLGVQVENIGHVSGAREFYRSAYEAAMAGGAEQEALDAARFAARAWRKSSEWDRAMAWYTVARSLAGAAGDKGKEALVLDGVAKIHKERGNLPRARQVLDEALTLALASGDRQAIGSTYHDLGAIASHSGQPEVAIRMVWQAAQYYDSEQDQLSALISLALNLVKVGELGAAENAYAVVARRAKSIHYRLNALSGFARIAGLRGHVQEYELRIGLMEASGFCDGPADLLASDWIDRGDVYERLGNAAKARAAFEHALAIAETHKLGQWVIEAEDGLGRLDSRPTAGTEKAGAKSPTESSLPEFDDIRGELNRMLEMSPALAGV